ncbi:MULTISPECIES: LysR substrate-binding domain-containing protein [Providencia]|uniref:Gcv operon activator n=1 Tax=Providencia rettgeri TaxID=587 RepID=A0A379FRG1_PRORE|nr:MULTISPECIES: LysR substrate-binding domain-containing protein [Providencia]EJF7710584.1 LysR family transcriptional regulator [Providencia rettgeri]ELR5116525.1 LysR family transcriptional regulator [Providencia rettgeri]MBI6200722.1 LysR family transcriptional regulator [Providencia rettgeri]MCG5278731.1 LysR substrate-binding domain-containing protein [Providencia rettgeri]MCX9107734.1 LysR substrate-binding domain-containing protein [Providencia rettgeri]
MKLPPLTSLRFFDTAAKAGSFVKAAQELNVTHSAISRQIRLLEEYLGVELFERRNRAVFLTANGQILLQTTSSIFEQLKDGVEKIKSSTFPDVVSLSCEPTIAMKWLIPRLTHFYQQYPHITVHLVAAGGVIDFTKANVDLALRRNDFKWNDNLFAVKVCSERMGVVVRPELDLKKNFAHIPQLSTTSRPNAWTTWQNIKKVTLPNSKTITYEHFYLCIQAALAGQGAALASFLMVADEVQSKQLAAPYGFIEDSSAYYLLSSKPIEKGSAAAIFTQWLIEQVNISIETLIDGR